MLPVVRVLAVLLFFVWLFALTFVAVGVLSLVAIDLLVWIEAGAVAGALHLAVIAALVARRTGRMASSAIAR
jgi:hypothetical protein